MKVLIRSEIRDLSEAGHGLVQPFLQQSQMKSIHKHVIDLDVVR